MSDPHAINHGIGHAVQAEKRIDFGIPKTADAQAAQVSLRREQTEVLRQMSGLKKNIPVAARSVLRQSAPEHRRDEYDQVGIFETLLGQQDLFELLAEGAALIGVRRRLALPMMQAIGDAFHRPCYEVEFQRIQPSCRRNGPGNESEIRWVARCYE
jgi:hypothetical protein